MKRPRLSKETAGDTDDEMPLISIDTPSPSSSKPFPIPDEPLDFGNIPEIKVLVAQSAPKVPSLTSLLQAVVDSGQLKQGPTNVVADSGAPLKLPSQAMDIGPGKCPFFSHFLIAKTKLYSRFSIF